MQEPHPPPCGTGDDPLPEPLSGDQLARMAKGLAHPVRAAILAQFKECRPRTAHEIQEEFDLAQSTISEHLRILKEADLLAPTADGPRTWHCFRRTAMKQFASALGELVEHSVPVEIE